MVSIHKYVTQRSRFEVAMERTWGPSCFRQLYLEDCIKLRSLNNFRCVYKLSTVVVTVDLLKGHMKHETLLLIGFVKQLSLEKETPNTSRSIFEGWR